MRACVSKGVWNRYGLLPLGLCNRGLLHSYVVDRDRERVARIIACLPHQNCKRLFAIHDHVLDSDDLDAQIVPLWLLHNSADRGIDSCCECDGISQIEPVIVVAIGHEQDVVVPLRKLGDRIPDR